MRQMKSSLYYIFWGIATVSVVAGQVYVGSGYREMANEIKTVRLQVTGVVDEFNSWMPWVKW